ncbi:MAG: Rrf2 family transcriptional regulator [Candidatus Omnitrophica bacterium]|nr:Rrf2 family transcriptional regulator [Candidatus Omnitrophota bacterium]
MKMITKNSDYAIRAILYMAGHRNRFVPSSEISDQEQIPLIYLRRILQQLIKSNLAESKEGVAGGVRLKIEPIDISVAQVINIIQGGIQMLDCMFRKEICKNRANCVLRKRIMSIEEKVKQEFLQLSIQDLINDITEAK